MSGEKEANGERQATIDNPFGHRSVLNQPLINVA